MFYAPKHSARKIGPVRRRAAGVAVAGFATVASRSGLRLQRLPPAPSGTAWPPARAVATGRSTPATATTAACSSPYRTWHGLRRPALRPHGEPRQQGPADHHRPEGPAGSGARRLAALWHRRRADPGQRCGGERRLDHRGVALVLAPCAGARLRGASSPSTVSAARRPTAPSSAGSAAPPTAPSRARTSSCSSARSAPLLTASSARRRFAPCRPRSAPARTVRATSTATPCARCSAYLNAH